jgi:hypothetical protein
VAWLLKIETDSILIKEKRKHLSKTSDRVSKMLQRKGLKLGFRERSHKSIYLYTKFIRYRISLPLFGGFRERSEGGQRVMLGLISSYTKMSSMVLLILVQVLHLQIGSTVMLNTVSGAGGAVG